MGQNIFGGSKVYSKQEKSENNESKETNFLTIKDILIYQTVLSQE